MGYRAEGKKRTGINGRSRRYVLLLITLSFSLLLSEPSFCNGSNDLDGRIKDSIEKGIKWLLSQQRKDGSFNGYYRNKFPMGVSALCLYALLSADTPPDSRAVRRAFAYLSKLPMRRVYSVSLLLLAVETMFRKQALKISAKNPDEKERSLFEEADKVYKNIVNNCTRWLIRTQRGDGLWSYGTGKRRGDGSNTQFALLALYSALRLGVDVPSVVFKRALKGILALQRSKGNLLKEPFEVPAADYSVAELRSGLLTPKPQKKQKAPRAGIEKGSKDRMKVRGVSYKIRQPISFSMTAAGLSDMVICKFALDAEEYEKFKGVADRAIRDAAAYIAAHYPYRAFDDEGWKWNTQRNGHERVGGVWGYYRLYSLERAGTMALLERFGEHNWYKDGAKLLVVSQAPDGSWGRRCTICTSFALLFLSRSTVAPAKIKKEDVNRLEERKRLPAPKEGAEKEPLGRRSKISGIRL